MSVRQYLKKIVNQFTDLLVYPDTSFNYRLYQIDHNRRKANKEKSSQSFLNERTKLLFWGIQAILLPVIYILLKSTGFL